MYIGDLHLNKHLLIKRLAVTYDGGTKISPKNWMDYYSNDLLNMWMGLRAYRDDSYLGHALMSDATFHDFCEFVYHFSHKYPDKHAT